MRTEALLFGGLALFFAATGLPYAWLSHDPAGTAALMVSFLMSSLVAFFFVTQYRRRGMRPEDRKDGEVQDRAGPLDFFPPHSIHPPLTAFGGAVLALGIVYGLWLFIIGLGVLAAGVFGFVFEYVHRDEGPGP
ncbi:cytochrome c oxidase subunit 4 [Streptomyces sp. RB6PN25]|uniref:Cytochrome c oxidase polypeptide 4 n=1 Tax=Streptomyces humicola TaxID=2953240 RepID=A0ABT1PSJ1_9ACTN|nr:cytochrome c oxidase subunit 4 [Streptomyces humicola]MCQ4080078.1 cytochrome c oxidase subunit 4 [Streptomyces humicola]